MSELRVYLAINDNGRSDAVLELANLGHERLATPDDLGGSQCGVDDSNMRRRTVMYIL